MPTEECGQCPLRRLSSLHQHASRLSSTIVGRRPGRQDCTRHSAIDSVDLTNALVAHPAVIDRAEGGHTMSTSRFELLLSRLQEVRVEPWVGVRNCAASFSCRRGRLRRRATA